MTIYQWLLMVLKAWAASAPKSEYTPPPPTTSYPVIKMFKSSMGRIVVKGNVT